MRPNKRLNRNKQNQIQSLKASLRELCMHVSKWNEKKQMKIIGIYLLFKREHLFQIIEMAINLSSLHDEKHISKVQLHTFWEYRKTKTKNEK